MGFHCTYISHIFKTDPGRIKLFWVGNVQQSTCQQLVLILYCFLPVVIEKLFPIQYMSNFSFCTVSGRSYTAAVNNEFKECVREDKELELYADIKICLNVLLVAVNSNQECNDYTCILGIRLQILQQSIGCWLII